MSIDVQATLAIAPIAMLRWPNFQILLKILRVRVVTHADADVTDAIFLAILSAVPEDLPLYCPFHTASG